LVKTHETQFFVVKKTVACQKSQKALFCWKNIEKFR